jgi:peptidoglycan-N-acetylglucosamine deacetylase
MDDWNQFVSLRDFNQVMPIASPRAGFEVYKAEFNAAWKFGLPWITVWHPFVTARLSRLEAMIELIDFMQSKGGVWFATLGQISTHVQRCIEDGWRPRSERLPYYTSPIPEL